MSNSKNYCPRCGYQELYLAPIRNGKRICPCCGTVYAIDDDMNQTMNILSSADAFYKAFDFDHAIVQYDEVLKREPTNSKAIWGKLLSERKISIFYDNGNEIPSFIEPYYLELKSDEKVQQLINCCDSSDSNYYKNLIRKIDNLNEELKNTSKKVVNVCIFSPSFKENQEAYEYAIDIFRRLFRYKYSAFLPQECLPSISFVDELSIYPFLRDAQSYVFVLGNSSDLNIPRIENYLNRIAYFNNKFAEKKNVYIVSKNALTHLPSNINTWCRRAPYENSADYLNKELKDLLSPESFKEHLLRQITTSVEVDPKYQERCDEEILTGISGSDFKEDYQITSVNPYLKAYRIPAKALTSTQNVEKCIDNLMSIFKSKSVDLSLAKSEISRFKNYCPEEYKANPVVAAFEVLANAEATNFEELVLKLPFVNSYVPFERIVEYYEKNDILSQFLEANSTFIKNAISEQKLQNSVKLFSILTQIKCHEVLELTKWIINEPYLYQLEKDEIDTYANLCFQYTSYYSFEDFINSYSAFVRGALKGERYDIAARYCEEMIRINPCQTIFKIYLQDALQEVHSNKDLILSYERKGEIDSLTDILTEVNKSSANMYISLIKDRIMELIDEGNYSTANNFVCSILTFDYSDKINFSFRCFAKMRDNYHSGRHDSYSLLDSLLSVLDESFKDEFFKILKEFGDIARMNGDFDIALKAYNKMLSIKPNHHDGLKGRIWCAIKSRDGSFDNIVNLKIDHLYVVEDFIGYFPQEKDNGIGHLLSCCVNSIDRKDSLLENDSGFIVFDHLLRYLSNSEMELNTKYKRCLKMGEVCLKHSLFDKAYYYFELCANLNEFNHRSYLGILQCDLKCRSIAEIEEKEGIILSKYESFKQAVHYASGKDQRELLNLDDRLKNKKKQKMKFALTKFLLFCFVLSVIAVLIVLVIYLAGI